MVLSIIVLNVRRYLRYYSRKKNYRFIEEYYSCCLFKLNKQYNFLS